MSPRVTAALCLTVLAGCRFDTRLPAGVSIACDRDDDCLPDQRCDLAVNRCTLPGAALLESASVEPARGARTTQFTLDVMFSVDVTAPAASLSTVATSGAGTFELASFEGRHARFTWTPKGTEADGVYDVLLDATAADGRQYVGVHAGTLTLDSTAPAVRVATLEYEVDPGNGLTSLRGTARATAATYLTTVHVLVFADSALTSAQLTAVSPDGADSFVLPADPGTQTSSDSAAFAKTLDAQQALAQGAWSLVAHLTDDLQNAGDVTLALPLQIDTAAPKAPDVDTPGVTLYRRKPWGSLATNGKAEYSVDLADPDAGEGVIATIAYAGGIAAGFAPSGTTTISLQLPSDLPTVEIAHVDGAGNLSHLKAVREVEWTVTHDALGASQPPLVAYARPMADPAAAGHFFDRRELGLDGSVPLVANGGATWYAASGSGPDVTDGFALDDDPELGGLLLVGGTSSLGTTSTAFAVWNGLSWSNADAGSPTFGVLPRTGATTLFDPARHGVWLTSGHGNPGPCNDTQTWLLAGGQWANMPSPQSWIPFDTSLAMSADAGQPCYAVGLVTNSCGSPTPVAARSMYCFDGLSWSFHSVPQQPVGARLVELRLLPMPWSQGDFVWVEVDAPMLGLGATTTTVFASQGAFAWTSGVSVVPGLSPQMFFADADRRELYAWYGLHLYRWSEAQLVGGARFPTLDTESTGNGFPDWGYTWGFDAKRHRAVTVGALSPGFSAPRLQWELDTQVSRPAIVLELDLGDLPPGTALLQARFVADIAGRGNAQPDGGVLSGAFVSLRGADGGYRSDLWDGGNQVTAGTQPARLDLEASAPPGVASLVWAVSPLGRNATQGLAHVEVHKAELRLRYLRP